MDLQGHDGWNDHIWAMRKHLDRLSGLNSEYESYSGEDAQNDLNQLDELIKHAKRLKEIAAPLVTEPKKVE